MKTYVVMAPPADESFDRLAFVKDGFCWPALFVPFVWLLYRRMWLVFFAWIAVTIGLEIANRRFGEFMPGLFAILFALLFALEANTLRRWTLAGRGWRVRAVLSGGSIDDAEIRYFSAIVPPGDDIPAEAPPPAPRASGGPVSPPSPVLGLFPEALR